MLYQIQCRVVAATLVGSCAILHLQPTSRKKQNPRTKRPPTTPSSYSPGRLSKAQPISRPWATHPLHTVFLSASTHPHVQTFTRPHDHRHLPRERLSSTRCNTEQAGSMPLPLLPGHQLSLHDLLGRFHHSDGHWGHTKKLFIAFAALLAGKSPVTRPRIHSMTTSFFCSLGLSNERRCPVLGTSGSPRPAQPLAVTPRRYTLCA
jgi:hypothetical protein